MDAIGESEISFDGRRVARAFERLLEGTTRGAEDALRPHVRGIVRTAAEITPPASRGVTGVAAKKAGEKAVTRDILRVFEPTRSAKKADTAGSSIPMIHGRHKQLSNGCFRTRNPGKKFVVLSRELNAYIREVKGDVGKLAGGFQPAAQALGFSLAAWMARHGTPGRYVFEVTSSRITVRILNEADGYRVPKMKALMSYALDYQANKIDRMLEDYLAKQARAAGL